MLRNSASRYTKCCQAIKPIDIYPACTKQFPEEGLIPRIFLQLKCMLRNY